MKISLIKLSLLSVLAVGAACGGGGGGEPIVVVHNSKIVFSSTRSGGYNVYSMNVDGTGVEQLTNAASGGSFSSSYSPDGTKIVFSSSRDGDTEIYIMDANGNNEKKLTSNTAIDSGPSFHPDGTRIIWGSDRDGNSDIYVMNLDGSGVINLTNTTTGSAFSGAVSPDGSKLAYVIQTNSPSVHMIDFDGTNGFVVGPGGFSTSPSFSPDGNWLMFNSSADGFSQIYTMRLSDKLVQKLTSSSATSWNAVYATNDLIYFETNRDDNWEIYSMNSIGANEINRTNNPAFDQEIVISGDLAHVVFRTDRDGNAELYRMNLNGTGQTNLTQNAAFENGGSFN